MSGKTAKSDQGLETAWIRELAAILDETGLTEIEIEKDDIKLRVAKQGAPTVAYAPAASPTGGSTAPAAPAAAASAATGVDHPGAVKSPMVGTVYLAPSPGAAPFVTEGASVSEGQTLMIVEAMKTMNPITAPKGGRVGQIFVKDAQPVEFDEALLTIE